jgi:signal transduction histidine kinase
MAFGSRYAGPRNLSLLAAACCGLALIALTWLALALPALTTSWRVAGDGIEVLDAQQRWQQASAIRAANGVMIPLQATLAIEEPDFLPDWAAYNALMDAQRQAHAAVAEGGAHVLLADGAELRIEFRARTPADLPLNFWMQAFFGLIALSVGFGVWAFRPRTRETAILLVTAIGYGAGIWSAALYSTRDLFMPADMFRIASVINHGGALLFDCAMAALLWHYPRPLGRRDVPLACALAWLLLWALDTLQVVNSLSLGFYLWLLLVFLLAMSFAIAQWRRAERDPVARAALQWLLLSFMIGSGTFVALQIVPRVLGSDALMPQSLLAGAFLIVYLGLAAGISRYRLFHLERWWRVTWSWLLGGILVVLVDALLLWQLQVGEDVALALALAIAGWLYFPLRQWLLERLLGLDRVTTELRPAAVRSLFDLSTTGALESRWPDVLARVFRPLSIDVIDAGNAEQPEDNSERTQALIEEHGLVLCVPGIAPGTWLRLAGCEQGTRLFREQDIRVAGDLYGIALHAEQTVAARAQGALRERTRIKRDLHDDMGARLLSILHGREPGDMREEARGAIHDLRQMLATLDENPVRLDEAAALIISEARERCRRDGIRFDEQCSALGPRELSARQFANIKRIAREGVTNALKHAGGSAVTLSVSETGDALLVRVDDNGNFAPAQVTAQGRGHHIVQSRVDELGGSVSWQVNAQGGCTLQAVIPWEMPQTQAD